MKKALLLHICIVWYGALYSITCGINFMIFQKIE